MPEAALLHVTGISKRFPGVVALDNVSFEVGHGEIHALVGENGAGKSTLIKILSGVHTADAGSIEVDGTRVDIHSPTEAMARGISLVPQEVFVVPRLSIGRNILLGSERAAVSVGSLSDVERNIVLQAFRIVGLSVDPEVPANTLSVPHLRLAQLARCLLHPGKIVVLDEPTAVLSEPDALRLVENLEALRDAGKAVIYVTHRLSEVQRLADKVTVLRDGKTVLYLTRPEVSRERIVAAMSKTSVTASGNEESKPVESNPFTSPRQTALEIQDLSLEGKFSKVTLSVKAGQIIGIAGVQGSGHGQLLWGIAQATPNCTGSIKVGGKEYCPSPMARLYAEGVLLLPADRRGAAIVAQRSVAENIALGPRVGAGLAKFGFRLRRAEQATAESYTKRLDIRPRLPGIRIGQLSGGNQQKVVIARALASRPKVLLVEEPTQGVDVMAKREIHTLLRKAAAETDCAVIVASSEFEELLELCPTIHVMRFGKLVHTVADRPATYEELLHHALP